MVEHEDEGFRLIAINDHETNVHKKFSNNSISTAKYNIATFLPKGLFEQFRRVANLYFLIIGFLSCIDGLSPVHWSTNVLPLIMVISVSMTKEAVEDSKRHKKDKEINSDEVQVLVGGHFEARQWKDVVCGDVVKVLDKTFFPADLVLLNSPNPEGVCFVETMNLDGETNLKIKKSLKETWGFDSEPALAGLRGEIECEKPNNSLYTFTGNLSLGGETLSLSPMQVLLRGSQLRNTEYIHGVVVFTGHESKVMMNAMDTPSKRSQIELALDKVIIFMFFFQMCICTIGAIGSPTWLTEDAWYLALEKHDDIFFDTTQKALVGIYNFLTGFILYSTLIPISLYVSLEIIKFGSVRWFVNEDVNMYHAESDTWALARTSNLNEELGQIQYVFSDKTGTLTQNLMEFFKCSIAGVKYGNGVTEIQRAAARRTGKTVKEVARGANAHFERGFNFDDDRLLGGNWANEAKSKEVEEFFRLLAVCHTVLPEGNPTPDEIVYQASSPDEGALVVGAKVFGFFFHTRGVSSVTVRETIRGQSREVEYEILNVLEFNSTRKRQSCIVRAPDGAIRLFCKGADNVIYDRLSKGGNEYREVTKEHLAEFGEDGLRTLCLAYCELEPAAYEQWNEVFTAAATSLEDREQKLDDAAELIEKDLVLLGCTAIEDKLQEGVPQCIEQLADAGIKIWVLTGDKVETAINIGYACSLLTTDQRQYVCDSETRLIMEAEALGDPANFKAVLEAETMKQLKEFLGDSKKTKNSNSGREVALVIDGRSLSAVFKSPDNSKVLLELGTMCQAVVCCRVSPLQKAQVTTLVKEGAGQVTLAIGDGANDVSMIQAAHIGVGISGQEGMQAVMASDFAIAQFRFLANLLLVHGRWFYYRIARIIGYFFYKNILFTLTQVWFNFYTGYSGQRLYDDWFQSSYNLLFTSVPVLVVGLLDQEVSGESAFRFPGLYGVGQRNTFFNKKTLAKWVLTAIYQSCVCFWLPVTAVHHTSVRSNGTMLGLWAVGTTVYTTVVMTVNMRLALNLAFWTVWHHIVIWGSILTWFIFVMVYCAVKPGGFAVFVAQDESDNVYNLIYELYATGSFWFCILLTPALCLLPDLLDQSITRFSVPFDHHIVQEVEKKEAAGGFKLDAYEVNLEKGDAEKARQIKGPSSFHIVNRGFAFDGVEEASYFSTSSVDSIGQIAHTKSAAMKWKLRAQSKKVVAERSIVASPAPTPKAAGRGSGASSGSGSGGESSSARKAPKTYQLPSPSSTHSITSDASGLSSGVSEVFLDVSKDVQVGCIFRRNHPKTQ